MAGLIEKQMSQAPSDGMGADNTAQHEGMESPQMEQQEGAEEDSGASQNDAKLKQIMQYAMSALYEGGAADHVATAIKASNDKVEGLANTSYDMAETIGERVGDVPPELIGIVGIFVLSEVVDIAKTVGVQVAASEVAAAYKQMLLRMLGEMGMNTSQLEQEMGKVDPAIFDQAAAADQGE